ncbi:hypothetical protein Anapl_15665 [Anas platyrhynchos]|uniref:Uncharacterized protein n=1 Tax=Anas platyrhynchos TaxID=8839 RepID=R0L055_ANAPL|nr:hypothetical protein Anapl_15665 [Anas platyrhynchos]
MALRWAGSCSVLLSIISLRGPGMSVQTEAPEGHAFKEEFGAHSPRAGSTSSICGAEPQPQPTGAQLLPSVPRPGCSEDAGTADVQSGGCSMRSLLVLVIRHESVPRAGGTAAARSASDLFAQMRWVELCTAALLAAQAPLVFSTKMYPLKRQLSSVQFKAILVKLLGQLRKEKLLSVTKSHLDLLEAFGDERSVEVSGAVSPLAFVPPDFQLVSNSAILTFSFLVDWEDDAGCQQCCQQCLQDVFLSLAPTFQDRAKRMILALLFIRSASQTWSYIPLRAVLAPAQLAASSEDASAQRLLSDLQSSCISPWYLLHTDAWADFQWSYPCSWVKSLRLSLILWAKSPQPLGQEDASSSA